VSTIAGVEPTFDDSVQTEAGARALSYSENVQRRNVTAAQRAMGIAFLYPEPAALKRAGSFVAKERVSGAALSKARAVLRFSEALADAVMADEIKLDPAYDQATGLDRSRQRQAEATRRLREVAPER
jgi:hypothetical protein